MFVSTLLNTISVSPAAASVCDVIVLAITALASLSVSSCSVGLIVNLTVAPVRSYAVQSAFVMVTGS